MNQLVETRPQLLSPKAKYFGAINFPEFYIERSTEFTLRPWLKIFDVYGRIEGSSVVIYSKFRISESILGLCFYLLLFLWFGASSLIFYFLMIYLLIFNFIFRAYYKYKILKELEFMASKRFLGRDDLTHKN